LGVSTVIAPHRRDLLALAARFGAADLRVFGSVARGQAGPDSDVDLLVRFQHPVGLFRRLEFQQRAEHLLGRPVDLASEGNLHWLIRPDVLAEAVSV
jgi:predicted nucleotidyltransferase